MSPSQAKFSCFLLCVTFSFHFQSAGAEGLVSDLQQQSDEVCRQIFAEDTSGKKISQAILDTIKINNSQNILKAERLAKSARKLVPDSPDLLAACAYLAYQHSKIVASPAKRDLYLEAAESLAKKSIDTDEKQELAYRTLGLVKLAQDRAEQAIVPLNKAQALNPDLHNLTHLAEALLRQNPHSIKAELLVDSALELSKDDSKALTLKALALCAKGDTKQALTALQRVQSTDRKAKWHLVQGDISDKIGDKKAALEAYMKATVEAPRDPETYRKLCQFYEEQKQYDLATTQYRKGLEALPNCTSLRMKWARLCEKIENFDGAESEYRTVLLSEPDSRAANNGLARVGFLIYRKTGTFPSDYQRTLDRLNTKPSFHEGSAKFFEKVEKLKGDPNSLLTLGEQALLEKEFQVAERAFGYALKFPQVRDRAQKGMDQVALEKYIAILAKQARVSTGTKYSSVPVGSVGSVVPVGSVGSVAPQLDQGLGLMEQGNLEAARQAFQESDRTTGKNRQSEYYLNFLNRIMPKAGDK